MTAPVLAVEDLRVTFPGPQGVVAVVDGIDFELHQGEVLGLVGESGSGKSMTLRALLQLKRRGMQISGRALWHGRDLLALPEHELISVRGREIAMIFQEPMSALNPVLSIGLQIDENLKTHTNLDRRARRRRALELLDQVGIPAAAQRLNSYPHQFSGGMRQRVMIAIALASSPQLLLADEPTTALDVTIQDQILKLLLQLRDEMNMSIILVTHDLGVIAQTCDRVAVMYAGRLQELAPVTEIFRAPRHPYTIGLLQSVPGGGVIRTPLHTIEGAPPAPAEVGTGCAFAARCKFMTAVCSSERPPLIGVADEHRVACLHVERTGTAYAAD